MKSVNRKLMILEALVDTLEQPQMQPVTTKILAEKCDITESALYKHYKNKQEIFEQLFRHIEQTIIDKTNEVKFKYKHPVERIRNLFSKELLRPDLYITIKQSRPIKVSIVGEIERPGLYSLTTNEVTKLTDGASNQYNGLPTLVDAIHKTVSFC